MLAGAKVFNRGDALLGEAGSRLQLIYSPGACSASLRRESESDGDEDERGTQSGSARLVLFVRNQSHDMMLYSTITANWGDMFNNCTIY